MRVPAWPRGTRKQRERHSDGQEGKQRPLLSLRTEVWPDCASYDTGRARLQQNIVNTQLGRPYILVLARFQRSASPVKLRGALHSLTREPKTHASHPQPSWTAAARVLMLTTREEAAWRLPSFPQVCWFWQHTTPPNSIAERDTTKLELRRVQQATSSVDHRAS